MNEQVFNEIVGEKLSAVVFVLDYHQLQFDGPGFNIFTPMTVLLKEKIVVVGEDQFRNALCEQIGKIVGKVSCIEGQELKISFEDYSSIVVSLMGEDYVGPEALNFYTANGQDGPEVIL